MIATLADDESLCLMRALLADLPCSLSAIAGLHGFFEPVVGQHVAGARGQGDLRHDATASTVTRPAVSARRYSTVAR